MTPAEFAQAMQAIATRPDVRLMGRDIEDTESKHAEADSLLIEVLMSLGYGEGCDTFSQMRKWYA